MKSESSAENQQSKAYMMKRLRAEKKEKGLVKIEIYDTPEVKEKILKFYASLKT